MLIFVACLVIFVYGMLSSLLGTIVPGLADQYHLTNAAIGYIALAQGLGLAGTSVFAGALMDGKGTKPGIVAGLVATLAGLFLLLHSPTALLISLSMFLLGCGGSIVIVGANAIANEVGGEKRAAAINFLNVFSGLGGLATPFIAGNLLGANPGKTAVFGMAATFLVLVVALVAPLPTKKAATANEGRVSRSPFASSSLYILSAITLLYTACEFGIWNWLPKYLIASGIPSAKALTILSLGFACGLLSGRLLATPLLWRVSPMLVTTCCAAAMTALTYLVLIPMPPWRTAALVFLTGIAMAPVFPTTISIVGNLFRHQAGTAIGFTITCGFSGLMLSSPIIGWLSGSNPMGVRHGLMLLPFLSGLILLILICSRKLLQGEETEEVLLVPAQV